MRGDPLSSSSVSFEIVDEKVCLQEKPSVEKTQRAIKEIESAIDF